MTATATLPTGRGATIARAGFGAGCDADDLPPLADLPVAGAAAAGFLADTALGAALPVAAFALDVPLAVASGDGADTACFDTALAVGAALETGAAAAWRGEPVASAACFDGAGFADACDGADAFLIGDFDAGVTDPPVLDAAGLGAGFDTAVCATAGLTACLPDVLDVAGPTDLAARTIGVAFFATATGALRSGVFAALRPVTAGVAPFAAGLATAGFDAGLPAAALAAGFFAADTSFFAADTALLMIFFTAT